MDARDLMVLRAGAVNLQLQARLADEGVERAQAALDKAVVALEEQRVKLTTARQQADGAHEAARAALANVRSAEAAAQTNQGPKPLASAGVGANNATVRIEEG